jgi:glycosyltransferase involved in cell wall biosynthesis
MRLVVANSALPFSRGEEDLLAERLVVELQRAGHEAELLRLPLGTHPREVLESMVAATLMQAVNVDRVIGLRFPAYLIPADEMVVWLQSQFRQAYDPPPVGWTTDLSLEPVVSAIHAADRALFARTQRLYARSPTVATRLEDRIGFKPSVLMTPPYADREYRTLPSEDYIVALGRLSDGRRQQLAIEAMRLARPGYRLIVAGAPENPEILATIRTQIDQAGLGDRVEVIPRCVTADERIDLLSRCIASVYLPVDEDSYGNICYEAAMSKKPTITGTDSGGTLTLVKDGSTGCVSEPEPTALADCFDGLAFDRGRAEGLGREAKALAMGLDMSWDRVVVELTR